MLEIAALTVGEPSTTGPINPSLTGFRTFAYLGSLSPFNLGLPAGLPKVGA